MRGGGSVAGKGEGGARGPMASALVEALPAHCRRSCATALFKPHLVMEGLGWGRESGLGWSGG